LRQAGRERPDHHVERDPAVVEREAVKAADGGRPSGRSAAGSSAGASGAGHRAR